MGACQVGTRVSTRQQTTSPFPNKHSTVTSLSYSALHPYCTPTPHHTTQTPQHIPQPYTAKKKRKMSGQTLMIYRASIWDAPFSKKGPAFPRGDLKRIRQEIPGEGKKLLRRLKVSELYTLRRDAHHTIRGECRVGLDRFCWSTLEGFNDNEKSLCEY